MNNALHFGTGNNATGTPLDYFAQVNERAGGFGCDVAADKLLTLVPDSWYGPDHDDPARRDSLIVPWPTDRPNWLNPPYSDAGRWLARLARHGREASDMTYRYQHPEWKDLQQAQIHVAELAQHGAVFGGGCHGQCGGGFYLHKSSSKHGYCFI